MIDSKLSFIPMAMIVPTKDRSASLDRMLESYEKQKQFAEVVIVDASVDSKTERVAKIRSDECYVRYFRTLRAGAAAQRSEGILVTSQPFILFCDDDVLFEPECLNRLWQAITSDDQLGGVSATIINQRYTSPGVISRTMFALLNGRNEKSFAGRILGPAVNLLPEDRDDLPEVVSVEWLNTTCTILENRYFRADPAVVADLYPTNRHRQSVRRGAAAESVIGIGDINVWTKHVFVSDFD